MKTEQILQLIEAVSASELTKFKYEEDGLKLSLKKTQAPMVQPQMPDMQKAVSQMSVMQTPAVQPENMTSGASQSGSTMTGSVQESSLVNAQKEPEGQIVTSPLVGTFYAAPAEDADAYVRVGDQVKEGQVLAIVEAMKLMNEIESDYAGTISEVLVENGQAVEYGQPLFVIR